MSLVNQMLRDLNARQAQEVRGTLHADVRPLSGQPQARRNLKYVLGGGVLVLVAVVALALMGGMRGRVPHEDVPTVATEPGAEARTQTQAQAQSQAEIKKEAVAAAVAVAAAEAEPTENTTGAADRAVSLPANTSDTAAALNAPRAAAQAAHARERSVQVEVDRQARSTVAAKPLDTPANSRDDRPEKHRSAPILASPSAPTSASKSTSASASASASGLRVDETLELSSNAHRGAGQLSSASTPAPVSGSGSGQGVQEKNTGRETNRSAAIRSAYAPSPPALMTDDRIVLTRKDKDGHDEKPEKIERTERADGSASPAAIEKQDRVERGDEGYRDGIQAYQQGRLRDAVVQLQAVLREAPRHLQARQALLGIYMEYKRYDDAAILLQVGLDQMPGQVSWAMTLARLQVERGNQAEALATLEKYQVSGERNADYQGFMAVMLQNLHRSREAVLRYKAALRLKPREGRWWFALGEALEADKRVAEATEAYRQAQSLGGLTPAMNDVLLTKKLR